MKLTSQILSSTCLIPTFWPANHGAEVDLLPFEADPTALCDGDRLVVEWIVEFLQAAIRPAGARVELRREPVVERLVRTLPIVFIDEGIELRLLLEEVLASGLRRFLLESQMHPLMAAVLLGMTWPDPLDLDPQA